MVPDLHLDLVANRRRIHEPVDLARHHAAAEQCLSRPNHHFAGRWSDLDDEHRLAKSARQAATLADRVPRKPVVRAKHRSVASDKWTRLQGRRVKPKLPRDDLCMIPVGHEADVLALRLLGDELEPELVRHRARLRLRLRPHGQQHPREHPSLDAPEEVRLVLCRIESAMQRTVAHLRIMAGRDPASVDGVGLPQQIAELRERVAAHAGNGRAAARVLRDEVLHHVAPEGALEIEHVVRHAELLTDAAGVVDAVE